MKDRTLVAVGESALDLPPGAERTGSIDDDEPAEVTFVLRGGDGGPGLSPAARFGPRLDAVHALLAWAAGRDLALEDVNPVARTITLSGPVGRWRALLGVDLARCAWNDAEFRAQLGGPVVPANIAGTLVGVFGLDSRPVGQHAPVVASPQSATVSPLQLRSAYRLPAGFDGAGQTIGVISLGGRAERSDLIVAALRFGLPAPDLVHVPARGGSSGAPRAPSPTQAEDQALALGVQVPAMLATGVQVVIYHAPNTAVGFVDAVACALGDRERRPSVLLITGVSGEQDRLLPGSLARSLDTMFATAGAVGTTVVAATSLGRGPRPRTRRPRTPHPASSPHVLACADTKMVVGARGVESEAAWSPANARRAANPSELFEPPDWQRGALPRTSGEPSGRGGGRSPTARMVPDVCAHGGGYLVTVGGVALSLAGGGSGAAVWAASVALLNQRLGRRLGLLAPSLYAVAERRWDPECGLGPPDGAGLARALGDRG